MKLWFLGLLLLVGVANGSAFAVSLAPLGTNGGNDFEHFFNKGFDFHIGMPKTWKCDGCDDTELLSGGEVETAWKLLAPEGTTWIAVGFVSHFPAASEAELRDEIGRRHPDVDWQEFDRGAFVGFTSSAHGDAAQSALEYYLVDRQQVIRIEWQTDGAYPARMSELRRVRKSIDRASVPPRIEAILPAPIEAYRPGEKACLFVKMDDLRNGFDSSAMRTIDIEGAPQHFNFKSIRWVPDNGWFEACWPVTTAFERNGLRLTQLAIESDSHSIRCERTDSASYTLQCYAGYDRSNSTQSLQPKDVPILNDIPDREGPKVVSVDFDPGSLSLKINAVDATGVSMAVLTSRGRKLPVYPDQLASGAPIDLEPLMRTGWNVIDQIVLYDVNGLATLIRVPDHGGGFVRTRRASSGDETYEVVGWSGKVSPTSIPVVAHLYSRGTR